jgi:hypothetical protein
VYFFKNTDSMPVWVSKIKTLLVSIFGTGYYHYLGGDKPSAAGF